MMSISKHITADDFVLIIRPIKSVEDEEQNEEQEKEHWTGEVQVAIVADPDNSSLTEEEYNNMIALCNCTAASIPAMEENVFLREVVQVYAQRHLISPIPESFKKYTNNVLTFASDTKGNA